MTYEQWMEHTRRVLERYLAGEITIDEAFNSIMIAGMQVEHIQSDGIDHDIANWEGEGGSV